MRCLACSLPVLMLLMGCGDDASGDADADVDADADADEDSARDVEDDSSGDSDTDTSGDSDTDAEGDSDADATTDGDIDADRGDADTGPCEPLPVGIQEEVARSSGCPWLGDTLEDVTINEGCAAEIDHTCQMTCGDLSLQGCPVLHMASLAERSTACVFVVESLTVQTSGSLRIGGERPVVFVANGAINISGAINVSGTDRAAGAGGFAGGVNGRAGGGLGAGGGGEGGTEISAGGGAGHVCAGGSGGCDGGGEGGPAFGSCEEILLAGGSGGGAAFCERNCERIWGGHGGGAVQLFSRTRLAISDTGVLWANGHAGADHRSGPGSSALSGGGGGAGGTILLEAPVVEIQTDAQVSATGGGGGDGQGPAGPRGGDGEHHDGRDGACSNTEPLSGSGGSASVGRVFVRSGNGAPLGGGIVVPQIPACLAHTFGCEK